ncbi:MAG: type III-A CRISPR-associated RAMP protein Csm3 [Caldisericaceae bacterium]
MAELKLLKKIFISGNIVVKTGLHIGGSDQSLSIGGVDSIVIRDPISGVPYIPGSSLKGKMRSLKEKKIGLDSQGNVLEDALIFKLFGAPAEKGKGLGRMIMRDSFMTEESIQKLSSLETELPYSEVKTEVSINRITSKANPRQIERVPAGAEFTFEVILDICEEKGEKDDETQLIGEIFSALALVQDDYLGGSGTRGYGKIKFEIKDITQRDTADYEKFSDRKPYHFDIPKELRK